MDKGKIIFVVDDDPFVTNLIKNASLLKVIM